LATNVYIDGFNFYYGAVKGTAYKWLNYRSLCEALFPQQTISRIRYFTALPKGLPHDPYVGDRHSLFLRALRTIPNFEIHMGRFADREEVLPQFPLAYHNNSDPNKYPPLMVKVRKSEEKRSDVNLATYLLLDCFNSDFTDAVVMSNDSDLSEPIRIVTRTLGKRVTVVNPQRRNGVAFELKQAATAYIQRVNTSLLATSQFPSTLTDGNGSFTKPPTW